MTDYRTMFDKDYIGSWDLQGDTVVTITGVVKKKIKNAQEKEEHKPILSLEGYQKKWVCNVTNCTMIANMYGKHVEKWAGKRVTIYPTQTQAFGSMKDCIRVRPEVPSDDGKMPNRPTQSASRGAPDGRPEPPPLA